MQDKLHVFCSPFFGILTPACRYGKFANIKNILKADISISSRTVEMSLNVFTSSLEKDLSPKEFFLRMRESVKEKSFMKGNQAVTVHFKREYTSAEVTLAVYLFNTKIWF